MTPPKDAFLPYDIPSAMNTYFGGLIMRPPGPMTSDIAVILAETQPAHYKRVSLDLELPPSHLAYPR